jgi:hypothetical protein
MPKVAASDLGSLSPIYDEQLRVAKRARLAIPFFLLLVALSILLVLKYHDNDTTDKAAISFFLVVIAAGSVYFFLTPQIEQKRWQEFLSYFKHFGDQEETMKCEFAEEYLSDSRVFKVKGETLEMTEHWIFTNILLDKHSTPIRIQSITFVSINLLTSTDTQFTVSLTDNFGNMFHHRLLERRWLQGAKVFRQFYHCFRQHNQSAIFQPKQILDRILNADEPE